MREPGNGDHECHPCEGKGDWQHPFFLKRDQHQQRGKCDRSANEEARYDAISIPLRLLSFAIKLLQMIRYRWWLVRILNVHDAGLDSIGFDG